MKISFTDVQVKSCKENKNGFNYFHYLYDYGRVGTFQDTFYYNKKNNVPKKKITPFKEKCNVLTLMKEENRKMRYTIRSSVLLVKKDGRE